MDAFKKFANKIIYEMGPPVRTKPGPGTRPAPVKRPGDRPSKPDHPMRPRPGVNPRPKAMAMEDDGNRDIKAFMAKRRRRNA
tara:strand:+ start:11107 stop:11352 length:246 start_codon:yes stop_codon:yes gene_type:complete